MVIELGGSVLKICMIYWVIYLELKTRALQDLAKCDSILERVMHRISEFYLAKIPGW
jgi:hypothetical protein